MSSCGDRLSSMSKMANHPDQIPIKSGVLSHRKPDVVIMRLDDPARAYSPSQSADWGQLKTIARNGVRPRSFERILSCVDEPGSDSGPQPRSAKRVAVESRGERSWYPRPGKESRTAPVVPKQTTESPTPHQKTFEESCRSGLMPWRCCRCLECRRAYRRYVLRFDLETCSHGHR